MKPSQFTQLTEGPEVEHRTYEYEITLTDDEVSHLGWLVNHGYFPEETYAAMYDKDEEDAPEKVYFIPEHAAWAIARQREDDPHSLFACTGQPLLDKLLKLEDSIV